MKRTVHTILFVDDDRRGIQDYATAVTEAGMVAQRFHYVDEALEYLATEKPADVVVWDMMMAPGNAFEHENTEGGLKTGRFFYDKARSLRQNTSFILLTNDPTDLEEYYKPEERSRACCKLDTDPEGLLDMIFEVIRIPVG